MNRRIAAIGIALACGLAACRACPCMPSAGGPPVRVAAAEPSQVLVEVTPFEMREDLVQTFRHRATAENGARFEKLRASGSAQDQDEASVLILSVLSPGELRNVGISAAGGEESNVWAVAWTRDHGPEFDGVARVLRNAGLRCGGSCDRGYCGWYLPGAEFFRARRALLADGDVVRLGVNVVSPQLTAP